jgi:vacuolar-type H+-ATPase subunit I/STV1
MIDEGLEIGEVIDSIISEFEDSFEDFDEAPTAVLALATLVAQNGFTSERLKNELDRIESEKEYWKNMKDENIELYEARLETLKKLKVYLSD